MDHVSILRLIAELRRRHGELEGVEAKAAHTGTPADLFKPLSAFANRAGGGILLFGLDEDAGFKVVGVGNPRKLQEDLSGLAAQMKDAGLLRQEGTKRGAHYVLARPGR